MAPNSFHDHARITGLADDGVVGWDSLISRYKLDEGSGTTAIDSKGSNDGTINGATWTSDSKIGGQALEFDGTDDSVDIGTFNNQTAYSIVFWSYPETVGNETRCHVVLRENNNILLRQQTDGLMYYYHEDSDGFKSITESISTNTWTHWAATWDGSTMELYKDATSVGTQSASGSASNGTVDRIGNREDASAQPFNGIIDDVRIYGPAISASDVQQIYDNTK